MHRTNMNMVAEYEICMSPAPHFLGDAAEYASYILNRSPNKSFVERRSPLQMLTSSTQNLSDIVVFGSGCMVHRDAKNKSLGERRKPTVVIGKCNKTKRYRVYILKENVLVVTRT